MQSSHCLPNSYCSHYYSHRTTKIDNDTRLAKLHAFINPVQQLWQNAEMDQAISSFGSFCDLLGLSRVRDYLVTRRVHEIDEWGLYQLDAEGQDIQKELEERLKVRSFMWVSEHD
jgi:exportin-5